MKRRLVILCLSVLLSFSLIPSLAFAKDVSFSLSIDKGQPKVGQQVVVTVTAEELNDMYGYEINLTFETNRLRYVKAASSLAGFPVDLKPVDGKIVFAHTKVGNAVSSNGKADLATITFEAIAGDVKPTVVTLTKVKLVKRDLTATNHEAKVTLSIPIAGSSQSGTFTDLDGHWAKQSIEQAGEYGFVTGYTDGTFKPDNNVTRAEFTAMIARAMKLESNVGSELIYADQISGWAKPFISAAEQAGIVKGYQDGTFRPNNQITRAEMTAMMIRALGSSLDSKSQLTFADADQIAVWARPFVRAAVDAGLIAGRSNNQFAPDAHATRAEATVFLIRLIEAREH